MHGAGNDFILISTMETALSPSTETIADWCHRRTGIGSDGLILLRPPQAGGHFYMQFFNPDGREASMCGNGARCAARLASDLQIAPSMMTIETAAGRLEAEVLPDRGNVRLQLPPPTGCQSDRQLTLEDGSVLRYAFANTGVPHVVIPVERDALDDIPLAHLGAAIRYHHHFAPEGTNVNVIAITAPDTLHIRTYERGVEAETLACGTGISASAVMAVLCGSVVSPVRVRTAGGDLLTVDVTVHNGVPGPITLTGPAVYVFSGTLAYQPQEQEISSR